MQQIFHLMKQIVEKMGLINPVFKLGPNRHPSAVGSLKETTRCFFLDELDIHVSLNKVLHNHFTFEVVNQKLLVSKPPTGKFYAEKYVIGETFDCRAYFDDFIETLAEAIKAIDLSRGYIIKGNHHNFTMLRMNLDYVPCLRCMDVSDHLRPQARRCRHQVARGSSPCRKVRWRLSSPYRNRGRCRRASP